MEVTSKVLVSMYVFIIIKLGDIKLSDIVFIIRNNYFRETIFIKN